MIFCEPLPQAGSIFDPIVHELVGHEDPVCLIPLLLGKFTQMRFAVFLVFAFALPFSSTFVCSRFVFAANRVAGA